MRDNIIPSYNTLLNHVMDNKFYIIMADFSDVALCTLVNNDRCFREAFYLHLQ